MLIVDRRLFLLGCLVLLLGSFARGEPPSVGRGLDKPSRPGRLDRHGDPLPPGAVARLGTVRFRNGNVIFGMAFSPDGKYLAPDAGSEVRLWEAATSKLIRRFRGHPYGVTCLDISADGKVLASGSNDGSVRLWDMAMGKEIRRMEAHVVPGVRSLTFSPDSKTLATTGAGGTIRLWNAATGENQHELCGDGSKVYSIAFSPDGKLLASYCGDLTVRLCEGKTGKELRKWGGDGPDVPRGVRSLAFAPDGKSLGTVDDEGMIHLRNVADGKETLRLAADGAFDNLLFSRDGKTLFSFGWRTTTLCAWDLASRKIVHRFPTPAWSHLRAIALSPDGKTLASADGAMIHLWEVSTGKEIRSFDAHEAEITSIVFRSGAEEMATGGEDGTVRRWKTGTGEQTHKIVVPESPSITLSPDGKHLLSVHREGRGTLREAATGKRLYGLGDEVIAGCAFSADGKVLAAGSFTSVAFWDVARGTRIGGLPEQREWPRSLAFSSDGKILAVGGHDGDAALWDMAARKVIRRFIGHKYSIGCVAFTPDDKNLATGSDDGTVRLWEVASEKPIDLLKDRGGVIAALAFSPDGKALAVGDSDGTIRLWDFAGGKEIRRLEGHLGIVHSLTFSPDGRLLGSVSEDTSVLLWDIVQACRNGPATKKALTPRELEGLWTDLAGPNAARAHRAMWTLIAAGEQSIPWMEKKVQPATEPDERRLVALLADLEDNRFTVRAKAMRELEEWAELAEPALRQRLDDKPPLESRRRISQLLGRIEGPIASGARLQELRAVVVLEHAGTQQARETLERLAKGAAKARLTREAKASLQRLVRQPDDKR